MSIPPTSRRPVGVDPVSMPTGRGPLAGLAAGPADGDRVLLVPGFTGSKEDFLPLLPLLAKAGLRAVALDLRGQFESPPAADPADYTLGLFAGDVIDVLTGMRGAHVVGHSFGGIVARAVTIDRPDLVTSLTLLDSGPGALPRPFTEQLTALRSMVPVATLDQIWQTMEALDREAGVPALPPAVQSFLHRRWLANDPWSLAGIAEVLIAGADTTADLARVLAAHHLPAKVLFGEDDATAWPVADQRDMAAQLGVPAVSIPGAAHSPAVENPSQTARELVGFITLARV